MAGLPPIGRTMFSAAAQRDSARRCSAFR